MTNFESRVKQPWTTYDNRLIQEETVFKNASQKLVYLYLCSYSNAKRIFPSMKQIGEACCISERNAIRIIKELAEMMFIEVYPNSGKPNNYILNDYFEIVEKYHPRQIVTPDKLSPLTNCQTKSKSKSKNKNKITTTTKNQFDSIDLLLKKIFPEAPLDRIKNKLIEDAKIGKVKIDSEKQYRKMLELRLNDYMEAQSHKTVKFRPKQPVRTENIPEWFDEPETAIIKAEFVDEELEAKKKAIEAKLKAFRK